MPVRLDTDEKRIVYRYVTDVWGGGRADLIDELVAPDVADHDPFPGQVPGIEGWKQALAMVRDAIPDLTNTIHDMVQEGDLVAIRFTSTGHLQRPFLGRGQPGDPVLIRALEQQRVSGGRMRETHRLLDVRIGQPAGDGAAAWDSVPRTPAASEAP